LAVPILAVQQALRVLFERWGLPAQLRMDNGPPWGPGTDLPPVLILWAVGLGIQPIWNRPARPTQNAKVERQNGTIQRWGEPALIADFVAWESRLEWVERMQREGFPTDAGPTRVEAHPGLLVPRQRYGASRESEQWQLERVTAYLAQWAWPRKVSPKGQISIYGKAYRVGEEYGGQPVWLRFDAATHEWVVWDAEGQELVRHAADQITTERICQLRISKPHASSQKRRRHKVSPPAETLPKAA
jgi:hypothetical protein